MQPRRDTQWRSWLRDSQIIRGMSVTKQNRMTRRTKGRECWMVTQLSEEVCVRKLGRNGGGGGGGGGGVGGADWLTVQLTTRYP